MHQSSYAKLPLYYPRQINLETPYYYLINLIGVMYGHVIHMALALRLDIKLLAREKLLQYSL